ncbi:MAG: ChbG/HpnK family deacetylase [Clostridia bacterium]|nr:ChbG/HpnK family deacetylase [Clostridia bacterium]
MKLIINAEDFGLSESINKGILEGLLGGFLTSASLMMNAKFCDEAIERFL